MIPKVIHYCWFGGKPKSEIINKCIASWREYCPDYEIIEWNENNFDVNCIPYTAAAYADKKWAFVSDYARLKIVYENGGIYLDTDVLLHNCLDELLSYKCWFASDDVRYINTGLGFGAAQNNPTIASLADAYKEYSYPCGTNVTRDTKILEQLFPEWKKTDKCLNLEGTLLIGYREYGRYAHHLYTYSWADEAVQVKRCQEIASGKNKKLSARLIWRIKCAVRNPLVIAFFDKRRGTVIEKIYTFCAYDLLDCGVWYFVKRLSLKIKRMFEMG